MPVTDEPLDTWESILKASHVVVAVGGKPRAVDREALGRRAANARHDLGLTQAELAMRLRDKRVDLPTIAKLEQGKLGFRTRQVWAKVRAICEHLAVEIPYVGEQHPKAVTSTAIVQAVQAEVMPAATDSEKFSWKDDVEMLALVSSTRNLEKVPTLAGRRRILDYLNRRFGYGFEGGEG
jgi:transcriptional regulator with XRE-family HTH domain